MVLLAAGLALQGLGAVAGMVGAGKARRNTRRVLAQISAANRAFATDRFDRSQTLADEMFGLGATDQLNTLSFLQRQASQEREQAGTAGSQETQGAGLEVLREVMGDTRGLTQTINPGDPAGQRLAQDIAFEGQEQQGLNLAILGAQGIQQGQGAFDLQSATNLDTQRAGLQRQGQILGQDSQTLQNVANLEQAQRMSELERQLGRAQQSGNNLIGLGGIAQLAGTGMAAAGAFQPKVPGLAPQEPGTTGRPGVERLSMRNGVIR